MSAGETLKTVHDELEAGMALLKCQKCGCMQSALENLPTALASVGTDGRAVLGQEITSWLKKMHPIQYSCLGCEHCFPAVAQNAFAQAFPSVDAVADLSCEFRVQDDTWPRVVGEYWVVDKSAPVAVSTLGSVQLAEDLAQRKPRGLAIVGKTETENIGLDKIIKNVVTSTALRHLIVAGEDAQGHQAGNALIALATNGVDENGRVIGSRGKRPILRNVSAAEIEAFRNQVQVVDMIGCKNPDEIGARIEELARQPLSACRCGECGGTSPVSITTGPKIVASEPSEVVKMDPAGYFVLVPLHAQKVISVEHYSYDNTLLRTIEGTNARAICTTIIKEGWVSELSHAAYLGKELAKAELSFQNGFKYVQDGA